MSRNGIFEHLFVLELATIIGASLIEGLKLSTITSIVRFNDVKAALKLQFRDVDRFIHPNTLKIPISDMLIRHAGQNYLEDFGIMIDIIEKAEC